MNKDILKDKSILVTGGTGSFGKTFIMELIETIPFKKIIVFSRDEFKQDLMKKDIQVKYGDEVVKKLRFFIGDVRDANRLDRAFKGVDIIIHAAAMKQVTTCEYNPSEAINTNVLGALNIIDKAIDNKVEKVVALSTDKAVLPINLYGGTKLVSDKLFISANGYSGKGGTKFSVVRYGNVSGSRGSVIPFFNQILKDGGEFFPITSNEMTRFWMTLDKAVNLVLLTIEKMDGGETFVYKNESYNVTDLAEAISDKIPQKEVGIREGEKIHEVMITKEDSLSTYDFGDYYVIFPNFTWFSIDTEKIKKNGGEKIPRNFEYHSGNNDQWLDVPTMKKLFEEYNLLD
ncbi:MAG: UDP-N-acetylglucosamine 4,6-dehydratase (inverting) [Anaerorhabdus sp.]